MKYSKTTGGFYSDLLNYEYIPDDAVEITEAQHEALLAGESAGKIIMPDESGNPTLADIPAPSLDIVAAQSRAQRNNLLQQTDWRVLAAAESGGAISDVWKAYRQALRDLPAQKGFPVKIKWPVAPAN